MVALTLVAGVAGFMAAAFCSAWLLPLLAFGYFVLIGAVDPHLLLSPWIVGSGMLGLILGYLAGAVVLDGSRLPVRHEMGSRGPRTRS